MAVGHVTLDGHELRLKGNGLPTQVLANQMAPKIGSGEGEYSNLDTWAAWIQSDWSEGIGKMNPYRNEGVLYSEAETRIPEQMILPAFFKPVDLRTVDNSFMDSRFTPQNVTGSITIGGAGNAIQGIAIPTRIGATIPDKFWTLFFAEGPGVTVDVEVWLTDSGPTPGVPVLLQFGSLSFTLPSGGVGYRWAGGWIPGTSLEMDVGMGPSPIVDTNVTLFMYPRNAAQSFRLATSTATYANSAWYWNGQDMLTPANFSAGSGTQRPLFYTTSYAVARDSAQIFLNAFDDLRLITAQNIYTYNPSTQAFGSTVSLGLTAGTHYVTSAVEFADYIWLGVYHASASSFTHRQSRRISKAGTVSDTGHTATLYAKHGGYLWRAFRNQVYYSADGSTWTGPFTVSAPDEKIQSMAGMGNDMYFATAWGLYKLMPGDFVLPVIPWGYFDRTSNGIDMVNHQGNLYVLVGGRILRIGEDGSTQDVWLSNDTSTDRKIGTKPVRLLSINNFLLCLSVSGEQALDSFTFPAIHSLSGTDWHTLDVLPQATSLTNLSTDFSFNGTLQNNWVEPASLIYDRKNGRVWAATNSGSFSLYQPDYMLNPYFSPNSLYHHNAWVDWDWFYGPIREADKDFESVTLTGENFSAGQAVDVYWKETDTGAWTLLGTVTANYQELRWAFNARPSVKRIKLGLLLKTNDSTKTPRVRSVRLKYHTMTRDWFRWTLPVDVSGGGGSSLKQELLDGTVRSTTAAQLKASLDAVCKKVAPVIYKDVDGVSYEVKVTDASFNYTKVDYNQTSSVKEWEGVYTITIEQVTQSVYTPPGP